MARKIREVSNHMEQVAAMLPIIRLRSSHDYGSLISQFCEHVLGSVTLESQPFPHANIDFIKATKANVMCKQVANAVLGVSIIGLSYGQGAKASLCECVRHCGLLCICRATYVLSSPFRIRLKSACSHKNVNRACLLSK